MSYYRLYPSKNTTIFQNTIGGIPERQGTLNTGKNSISEIMSGGGKSAFLMQFDLTSIKPLLQKYSYTCNLQLFDAGQVFEPATQLKTLDVCYFTEDFSEGDGWFFSSDKPELYKYDGTTWVNRLNSTPWNPPMPKYFTQGNFAGYQLNDSSEDVKFENITSFISDAVTGNIDNPSFAIRITPEIQSEASIEFLSGNIGDTITNITVEGITIIDNNILTLSSSLPDLINLVISTINSTQRNFIAEKDTTNPFKVIIKGKPGTGSAPNGFVLDVQYTGLSLTFTSTFSGGQDGDYVNGDATYTKFLYTRHTRTIYKPYIEFFINDEVVDHQQFTVALDAAKYYLLNNKGTDFVGVLTASIVNNTQTDLLTVTNNGNGIYETIWTPPITASNKTVVLNWYIDGVQVAKRPIEVQSPNQLVEKNLTGLYFYPTAVYTHSQIRKNDLVEMSLVSEIKGKGCFISDKFEFKVVSSSGFEIIPWSKVNVYMNDLYFYVDTAFFFEDLEYEVFVRYNDGVIKRTSNLTYKFRLVDDIATHLKNKSASPYNRRDNLFNK